MIKIILEGLRHRNKHCRAAYRNIIGSVCLLLMASVSLMLFKVDYAVALTICSGAFLLDAWICNEMFGRDIGER
jgi:hypothetical protein